MKKIILSIILLEIFSLLTLPLISQNNFLYSDGFESLSDFSNWSQEKISGNALWILESGLTYGDINTAQDGQTNACFSSFNYNSDQTMLISPTIDLSQSENTILTFYHIQPAWSSDQDILNIYYRSNSSNNWTLLKTIEYSIEIWTKELIALPDASENYQIAFSATSGYGYGIGIDNLTIQNGEACDPIKNFNFINIKETSTLINWETNCNSTFEIEYGSLGYEIGNGQRINNISKTTHYINDLNPGEAYSLYIRSYCEQGISEWSGPYNFVTECAIGQQIPYTESFENASNPLECWSIFYPSDSHNPENDVTVNNDQQFSGQNSLRFSSYEVGSPYDQYLISPELNINDTLEISFKYRALEGSDESFEFGLSTNSDAPLSFVSWNETVTDANESWKTYKALILPGTTNFVIHYNSIYEYYLYIDDIRINYPGQCDVANNLMASEIAETSAKISWEGSADVFKIEYGFAGFNKGDGFTVSETNDNSANLYDLIPGTEYYAYVITNCGGTEIYSEPISFTTDETFICNAVNQIYAESIATNEALIVWESTEEQTSWNIEYGLTGFTQGEGITFENLFDPAIEIKYLEANTTYDFYVQVYCDENNEYTDWSQKFTFTTNPEFIVQLPDHIDIVKPTVDLIALDSTIYICDNSNYEIKIDFALTNTSEIKILEGAKIPYTIELQSKNQVIPMNIELPCCILPGKTYNFSENVEISNPNESDLITIGLSSLWRDNSYSSDIIEVFIVSNDIRFDNETDGIIQVDQLPEFISADYESNFDYSSISYIWNDNVLGESRIVNTEGSYSITISTDFCEITKSVNVDKIIDENQNQFDIYPNPSQNGQLNLINNSNEIINVEIYDAAGRNVFSTSLSNVVEEIDLSNLAAGIYNVAFIQNDNVELKRLYID